MQLTPPVVGILRGIQPDFFKPLMQASFANGLQAIEVTMNTDQAERIIEENRPLVTPGFLLGMGTIRTIDEAKRAVAAGAMFLVSPNLDRAVIDYAKSRAVPIIAGALTPTEVHDAWAAGADLIKVFPCGALGGADYIRALRGPFEHIPLVAVGGVSQDSLADYLRTGTTAVGVSAALFGRTALAEQDAEQAGRNVKSFISHCEHVLNTL